jgi:isopentenyl phosphate kinase
MAHFLRDQQITNLSTTEENLAQLSSTFLERIAMINANVTDDARLEKGAFVTYVIRFDNKGYRVFSLDDLLRYFAEAKTVERVLFTLETG